MDICIDCYNYNSFVFVLWLSSVHSISLVIINALFFRRRFDFQSPSRLDRNVELFLNIEKSLKEVRLEFDTCDAYHNLNFLPDVK